MSDTSDEKTVRDSLLDRILLIFTTGVSEIRRKGAVTRLHFEIKTFDREKEKYIQSLGLRAWEAHVKHADLAPIIVHLKELQIETNRANSQFGEHDTQIKDIQSSKTELTSEFNQTLDRIEHDIVPHREGIEKINAEKEEHKKQIEELRTKQAQLVEQIRLHQQNIQKFDLADETDKSTKIQLEQDGIRKCRVEESEIDCKMPLLLAQLERLKAQLAAERATIQEMEGKKELAKRDYEKKIKDSNTQIRDLEEKKKDATRQIERFHDEMEPYLYDLGKKVEQLRIPHDSFREDYEQLDRLNSAMSDREKQILEAESLSRAMDRGAWTGFLVFSGSMLVLVVTAMVVLLR
jgi:predicted  nucleic acid-binding Zn-ribbon protein